MPYEIPRETMYSFPSSLCGTIPNLRLLNFPSWVEQSTLTLLPVLLRQLDVTALQKGRCWIITLKFLEIQLCIIHKGTKAKQNTRKRSYERS